jgi:hypothetical protein
MHHFHLFLNPLGPLTTPFISRWLLSIWPFRLAIYNLLSPLGPHGKSQQLLIVRRHPITIITSKCWTQSKNFKTHFIATSKLQTKFIKATIKQQKKTKEHIVVLHVNAVFYNLFTHGVSKIK